MDKNRAAPGIFLTATALIFAALAAACAPSRISTLAPRRHDTADHRAAANPSDCLECHETARIRDHKPVDSCLDCHKLIPGR